MMCFPRNLEVTPNGGAVVMTYVRITPTEANAWTAFINSKPVATVTRRAGKCSAQFTADRALSAEEVSALSVDLEMLGAGNQ
jgi:hypothetical protein